METRTTLYIVLWGTVNSETYINEMLPVYVFPHVELVGTAFLLIHDSARHHSALIVRENVNNAGIPHMEWAPHSPDLKPIEHFWDKIDGRIRNTVPEL